MAEGCTAIQSALVEGLLEWIEYIPNDDSDGLETILSFANLGLASAAVNNNGHEVDDPLERIYLFNWCPFCGYEFSAGVPTCDSNVIGKEVLVLEGPPDSFMTDLLPEEPAPN